MRTDPAIIWAYSARGARLWLGTRAIVIAVLMLGGADPFELTAGTVIVMVGLSIAVGFVDTYRHGERMLLANLAVSPLLLGALFAVPAIVGEAALRLAAVAFS
ncbi:MAG: hypothetical protein ACRENQ_14075 [Gemmatimonadaceae bacterium]